jgi:amidase
MPQKTLSENKIGSLNRRGFLRSTFAGGIASAALPAFSFSHKPDQEQKSSYRMESFVLAENSIADLQEGMKSGKLTSRSIAEQYIARIEVIDRQGPMLRSVIELNPDALEIAAALDRERREKGPRGPMHGIPVLIKDTIDTTDRMATTAGSLALVGSKPRADAFVVQQLRQAGAVILGKTNLSEWANIRSNRSTSGWSGRGGLTRNPYALDRNTSGSSSGSAVAVSSNLCTVAVGTETDGSIVSPSSINGIVGIKPTIGLISRSGIIPISHTQDTAGPMARNVRDAAILLSAMAARNDELNASEAKGRRPVPAGVDYTQHLNPEGLKGRRIGIVRKYFGFHRDVDRVISAALDVLKAQGAILVDPADIATLGRFDDAELTVLLYELKADLNRYLSTLGSNAPAHSLKDIIDFNERNFEKEMPYFGQELFLKAEAKGPLSSREYLEALLKCGRLARKQGIDAVMDKHKLDALVAPTDSPAWMTDLINGDHFLGGSSTAAAVAGYPSITVPAGFVHGLPVGISFFGRAWSESMLLQLAYAFEQATRHRNPPAFLPTTNMP